MQDSAALWSPLAPSSARPWTPALASHLLRRAGFGVSWGELQQAVAEGPAKTVSRLLQPPSRYEAFEERLAPLARGGPEAWLYRILETPWPLLEKMTLFWHNHFGVAASRSTAELAGSFISLLRRHALGRFDQLLAAVCRHPALYVSLGARACRKSAPETGLASALLGLYTVGPGVFGESDVRETARAFTGAYVLRDEFRWLDYEHDAGEKTILGRKGNFDIDGAVRVLLEHPSTARFIVRKVYRWLVSEMDEPAGELLEPLAAGFARDYDIARLVGTVLRSNHFFSEAAYKRRVKSPVEYAAAIAAALEISPPAAPLHQRLAGLGQNLFDPPTREGWAGGRSWLNQFTLVARANLAASMLAQARPEAVAEKHGSKDVRSFFARLLIQSETPAPILDILVSTEFQLA